MYSNSHHAHYINNSVRENLHERNKLYVLKDKSLSMQDRIKTLATGGFIDHTRLTFNANVVESDNWYGSALTEEDLRDILKAHEEVNEHLCKLYIFDVLEQSLSSVLSYIQENLVWFANSFDNSENVVSEIYQSLAFIEHSKHEEGANSIEFTFNGIDLEEMLDKCRKALAEQYFMSLVSDESKSPSFQEVAFAVESCLALGIKLDNMASELEKALLADKAKADQLIAKLAN